MQLVEGSFGVEVTPENIRGEVTQRFMSPFFTGMLALMCPPGKIQIALNVRNRVWHVIVIPDIRKLENVYVTTFDFNDRGNCVDTFLEVAAKAFHTGKVSI